MTQTHWVNVGHLHGQPLLQAVHTALLPSKLCQEALPELLGGAVFSCNLTGEPIGLKTSFSWVSKPGQNCVRLCSPCLRRLVLGLVSVL